MIKNSNHGLALTIVVVLVLLISLLSAGILILANNHYRLSQHLIDSTKAFYLAEAGIHYGLFKMRFEIGGPTNEAWSFKGTDIGITFVGNPSPYTYRITATVTTPARRSIRVDATRDDIPPNPTRITDVENWQEI
jgi:hypothetical protein